jgi:hypothetical protein
MVCGATLCYWNAEVKQLLTKVSFMQSTFLLQLWEEGRTRFSNQ